MSKTDHFYIVRARNLRKAMPRAEVILWRKLRELRTVFNITIRRQHPLPPYVVDFFCVQANLIIEIDGMSHDVRSQSDSARDLYLRRCGYHTMRFANEDVINNIEGVVETIIAEIKLRE